MLSHGVNEIIKIFCVPFESFVYFAVPLCFGSFVGNGLTAEVAEYAEGTRGTV